MNYKPTILGGWPGIAESIPSLPKKVCICIDYYNFGSAEFKKTDYKVFLQIEPPEVIEIQLDAIIKADFDLILCWYEPLLKCSDKAFKYTFGDSWIKPDDREIYDKNQLISIIASSKTFLEGHRLRHKVVKELSPKYSIPALGNGYRKITNKKEGLSNYRYSLIIENVRHKNWFNEKIVDSLVCGTVPIYWGCPNIGDYFNIKGFHIVNNYEEIEKVLNEISEEDYLSKMKYIKENFETCTLAYKDPYLVRLADEISVFLTL